MSIHDKPTHPETGEEIDHYEANGALFCHDEGEFFDWQTGTVECPHCGDEFEVEGARGIFPMSDGIELLTTTSRRVRPVLKTEDGERVYANRIWEDSEDGPKAVYGKGADDFHVELSFEEVDRDE